MFESLDLSNVQTYVQSGNIIFDSDKHDKEFLRETIEAQIERNFGFSVPVLILTPADLQRIIESHPYKKEEANRVLVTFLYETPEQSKWEQLRLHRDKADQFTLGQQEIFLFCLGGYGRTKLSNNFFERKLGMTATTRNWKTINVLYKMATDG